jgi:hypothetical protein
MALVRAAEFFARRRRLGTAPKGAWDCKGCNTPLQESITGCRKLADGSYLCSDCYFKDFGSELENFPILTPRVRRG